MAGGEKTVLATKVFEDTAAWPNNGGLSALNIRRACDASLKKLQTDYIDVYQMHHIDRGARWEEIWEAYEILRMQGKILYAGSSNFAGWHLALAQGEARNRNFLGLVSEQHMYNLAQRTIELKCCPLHSISESASSPTARSLGACSRRTPHRRADGHHQSSQHGCRCTPSNLSGPLRSREKSGRPCLNSPSRGCSVGPV